MTKTMNTTNVTSNTRTYNLDTSGLYANRKDRCAVSIKVNGKEVGMISFIVNKSGVTKLANSGNVNQQDILEATVIAKHANKIK